jgi:hypothetical protein
VDAVLWVGEGVGWEDWGMEGGWGDERRMIDSDMCILSAAERCIGMVFGVIDVSH